jgi:hypothetical protein
MWDKIRKVLNLPAIGTKVAKPLPDLTAQMEWGKQQRNLIGRQKLTPTALPTPTILPDFVNVRPDMQSLISKYFPENSNEAINVFAKESSLNPTKTNINDSPTIGKTRDIGLTQTNEYWQAPLIKKMGFKPTDLYDPENSLKVAREIYNKSGWKPWYGAKALGIVK